MAKVALLIGVSEYEPGLNPLPAAVKDLDAMKEVLLHPEMGGFAESDILLLKNPNRQEMEESIETLFANRHKDDLVLLFFSGHGIKDDSGRLYLGTSKTRKTARGELVRSSAVAANFVHENMSRSRSKRQVVILDSCFSGAFAEGLSAKDDGTVDIRTQLGGEGRAVLTSSNSTQYSFEQEGEELSLYTRFLIEGIKTGEADVDGDDFVSIDELHEYASRKVREVKPEMKPEIYAVREGFKIRLSNIPQGDPHTRYRKEVGRCGKRGELTIVNRSILDRWRTKLGLSVNEAKALEDEVLAPYRREFQQNLQQYEQTVTEVLRRDGSINDDTRQELQHLQKLLDLRNQDTVPIEERVTARLKTLKQNLQTYAAAYSKALRQEYPLGEAARFQLQQQRQQLVLSDADVAPIEAQITDEVKIYQRNLQQYEQAFLVATQQEYSLSEVKRNELRQYQQSLGLTDVEIAPIEAAVTTQRETYHKKLQQYEEAFASATHRKHQPSEANRTQLRQTWQTLGLSEGDVKAIEAPILAQIETYQTNLRQYEQVFADATEQQYPLSQAKRSELRQRQQNLSLSDEDIAPIESKITTSVEELTQKIQQYEQVFSESIQYEYPLTDETRKELKNFQKVLDLSNEVIDQIEGRILASEKTVLNSDSNFASEEQISQIADNNIAQLEPSSEEQTTSQTVESDEQKAQDLQKFQQYELEVAKWIQYGISLQDSQISKRLLSLRFTLGISGTEAEAIERRLSGNNQTARSSVDTDNLYQQKRQQYEQEVLKNISLGISLDDGYIRSQLKQLQRRLKLTDADVSQIEQQVLSQRRSESSQASTASPPPVQPQYRRDSVASKVPQANPVKTPGTSQPNTNDPSQHFLESGHSSPKVGEITQQHFWLMWMLAYTCGSGFGWSTSNLLVNLEFSDTFSNLIRGAIVGFMLGGAQWLVLRRINSRMKLWIVLTTAGYATGYAIAATLFGKFYGGNIPLILIESLYGIVVGGAIGLAQWFVLKPMFQQSKTWFVSVSIAETLGGAIGWGVFGVIYLNSALDNTNYPLHGLIAGGCTGAISGLITGGIMFRLLRPNRVQ